MDSSTIAEEFQSHVRDMGKRDRIITIAPLGLLVAIILFLSFTAPGFASLKNAITLLNQMSIPLIIATGITFVVLIGGLDLSVDGVMGFTGAFVGMLVFNDKTGLNLGFAGIIVAVLASGGFGLVTGFVSVKGKIPSFMVSFAMSSISYGIGMLIYGGMPPVVKDPLLRAIALTKIASLPVYFYIAVALFLAALVIQEKTAFGKYVYAIGESEQMVRMSGIKTDRIKFAAFALSGLFVGVAGVCAVAQIGRGDVVVGVNQVFPALAAVVVGGTSLSGGKGGVHRTLLGVFIITILNNGLVLVGANPYLKNGIMGIILIVAVIVATSRKTKEIVK
jgi:ribose transport system permease protein